MQLTYLDSLQRIASEAQKQIDALMPHMGEKGRLAEEIIKNILVDILPSRFSIGTGVIISADNQVSNQVDIVIYDRLYNAPMISNLSACVYPIECVYAFIEVKTTLNVTNLKDSFESVRKIRKMGKKKSYIIQEWEDVSNGRKELKPKSVTLGPPPRGYIVAFKRGGISDDFDDFKKKVGELCDEKHNGQNTFIHGICILKDDWFISRIKDKVPAEFRASNKNALANLYKAILIGQSNYAVYPMNIEQYLPD